MKIGNYFLFISISALSFSANSLTQQDKVIPKVVVSAKRKPSGSLSGGPQTIIDREQIRRAGVTTLAQALQSLGGIQLQNLSGNDSAVVMSLRGFGGNAASNALLLVNGMPITNPDLASPNLNIIPMEEIEFVKIIAGSESVLYGDQAVGGVVMINTREWAQAATEIACTVGSYHLYQCTLGYRNQYKRLQYGTSLSIRRTDNYRRHNHYDQSNLLGQIEYHYARGRIDFDYQAAQESLQYPGALTNAQVRQNRTQANNAIDYFKDWNGFLQLRQQQELNCGWQMDTNLTYRNMSGAGVLYSAFTQSRSGYFLSPEFKGKIKNAEIKGGADWQTDHYRLKSAFGITEDSQQKYGAFGLVNIPLYPRLDWSAGARAAQQHSALQGFVSNDNLNRALAATLGLSFRQSQELRFYLRRAGSFRFPKADENASTATGKGLRTQRGVSYEAGSDFARGQYKATVDLYQLNLRDEIAFDPLQTRQNPFGTNRNLSPTVRRGLNLSGYDSLTSTLNVSGQYHFVHARFQNGINAGRRIPLVAESIFQTGIEYHPAENWFAYAETLFTGSQYAANDDANRGGKLGGYTIYNFNIRFEKRNINASLRLNNIFNKYYYFYTVYQPGMGTEFFYPAPGRNFSLSVNFLFPL